MAKEDEVVDELIEQMKAPGLSKEAFLDLAHRIRILRGLIPK